MADVELYFETDFVCENEIFEAEFESVVTTGDPPERQEKTVTITENGTQEVVPDTDKFLSKVTIITDVIGANAEEYKGSYEVTPKAEEQILETALKVMRDDVTVHAIIPLSNSEIDFIMNKYQ